MSNKIPHNRFDKLQPTSPDSEVLVAPDREPDIKIRPKGDTFIWIDFYKKENISIVDHDPYENAGERIMGYNNPYVYGGPRKTVEEFLVELLNGEKEYEHTEFEIEIIKEYNTFIDNIILGEEHDTNTEEVCTTRQEEG